MAANRIPGENLPAPLRGEPEVAFATGRESGIEALEDLGVKPVRGDGAAHTKEHSLVDEKLALESSNSNGVDSIHAAGDDVEAVEVGKGLSASDKVHRMEEIALYALHVDDDPTLNPWTFRTWFLGKVSKGFRAIPGLTNQDLAYHASRRLSQLSMSSSRKASRSPPPSLES
jgi:hypothetical protein